MVADLLDWTSQVPTWLLGLLLLAGALAAGYAGHLLRLRGDRRRKASGSGLATDNQEGYIVSGVLGLLALMLGFTLAMAVDRFDTRRLLVLQDANAIETTYLRAQLLDEPHRARISKLLVDYTDNRIVLGTAKRGENAKLLADNDRMLIDLWAATAAAFETIADLDFSTAFIDSVNNVVELDAARKASRLAHVPTTVLAVLAIYIVVTGGVLGLRAHRNPRSACGRLPDRAADILSCHDHRPRTPDHGQHCRIPGADGAHAQGAGEPAARSVRPLAQRREIICIQIVSVKPKLRR